MKNNVLTENSTSALHAKALKVLAKVKAMESNTDKVKVILDRNTSLYVDKEKLDTLGAEKIKQKYEDRFGNGYFSKRSGSFTAFSS